ncbi:MAG: hypothetical protein J6B75_07180 [Ruminococcus sp.]|nr:hypothetical protein [Ruminococcus sp.]
MRGHVIHLFWWLWGSVFSYVVSDYVLQILGIAETDMLGKIIVIISVILGFIAGLYATIRLCIFYRRLSKSYLAYEKNKYELIETAIFLFIFLIINVLLKNLPQDYKPKPINGWDD